MEDPKSPTPGKDKGAALTPTIPISRGRRPNQPARNGKVTRARATSVPTSRSQQPSPTRGRSSNATCGRADKVSPNSIPTANQVRLNATTNPQEPSKIENIISGNDASGNAILVNKIVYSYPEKSSSQCIQDLKLTNPHWDRVEIEECHGDVCEEHLQKVREHPNYKCWKNDDTTRLLWIYSHTKETIDFKTMDFETGDQKRIIAVAVAKELEQSPVVRDNALSYMFCRNSKNPELKLNDIVAVLRGLMWPLSFTQESLNVCLEETYNREGKSMYTDEHAKRALSDILLRWLKDTNVGRVYLVVGAIDECYIERKDILDLITTCCKGLAKVKWLITSDCDDIYIDYIKARLDPHDPSFKTIHLNERRKTGSKAGPRANRRRGKRKKALGKGTKETNQEMERGGEESAQVGEGYLDKRKGGASDTIPEEYVEEYVGEFFKGGAGGNKYEKPEVSGWKNGANAGRAKELKISDEGTPPLTKRTPSSPSNSGESTPVPQHGSVSKPGSLNIQDGSAKRGCSCVVQ